MDPEVTLPPRRRTSDAVVDHLHDCVEELKRGVEGIRTEQRTVLKELTEEQAKVLAAVTAEQAAIRSKLDANTLLTAAGTAQISEVRDILVTFTVVGRVAKWLTYIFGAITAIITAVKLGLEYIPRR